MKKLFIPFLILFLFQACDKDEPSPSSDTVNTWIYDNMKYWYYWTNDIPSDPDRTLEPDPFFHSLLSTDDRFSWIQPNFSELLNSLRGVNKEAGFEFALYRESEGSNNVNMQVLYVKPGSPATSAALKRGDVVHEINGTQITVDNYAELLEDLSENHSLNYQPLDIESGTLGSSQTISLIPVEYAEDPNFLNKVMTYDDRKIGYYVYNLFAEGPDENSRAYSNEMDDIFASFKSQGVTDLIIDLRFNSGGAESAAQKLASLIAPGVSATTVFVEHQYNEAVTNDIKNDPDLGEAFLKVPRR